MKLLLAGGADPSADAAQQVQRADVRRRPRLARRQPGGAVLRPGHAGRGRPGHHAAARARLRPQRGQRQRRHGAAPGGDQPRRARDRAVPASRAAPTSRRRTSGGRRRWRPRWRAARTSAHLVDILQAPPRRNEASRLPHRAGRCVVPSPMSAQDVARPASATPAGCLPAMVGTYCASCHNGRLRSPSGPLLEAFDAARRRRASGTVGARLPAAAGGRDAARRGAAARSRATVDAALAGDRATRWGAASARRAPRRRARRWPRDSRRCCGTARPTPSFGARRARDRLRDAAAVERQVRRMLADDRAQAFVARFFFPWLQLDALAKADPDRGYFPDYDVALRDALAKETELFLLSQLRDDRDPIELWSAHYTFLNERLAQALRRRRRIGPEFRRVALTAPERAGLLGHGSVLMVTSRHQHGVDAAYTTPATRAKWVRLHYLRRAAAQRISRRAAGEARAADHAADAHAGRRAVRQLPPQLLPDWLRARELRSDRPLAHARSGGAGGRVGRVRGRHADQRRRRAARGAAAASRGVPHDGGRKAGRVRLHRDRHRRRRGTPATLVQARRILRAVAAAPLPRWSASSPPSSE